MSESNNNTPMKISQLEEATAYENGMYYAVAKAGSGTKKISVDIINQKISNIIDITGMTNIYAQNGTSNHVANLKAGKKYIISYSGSPVTSCTLYDTNTYNPTEQTNNKIWDNATNVSVSITPSRDYKYLHLYESGASSITVSVKEIGKIEPELEEIKTNYVNRTIGKNLYNKNSDSIVYGKYVNYASGYIEDVATMQYETYKVIAGETYIASGYTTQLQIAFFNGAVLLANYVSGQVNNPFITIPNDCNTMTISIKTSDADDFMLERGTTASSYEPYSYGVATDDINYNAVTFEKLSSEVRAAIGKNVITVGSVGCDYTSFSLAVKENQNDTAFLLMGETFDIEAEYKSIYGNDFFDNYVTYTGNDDPMYRGVNIGNNCDVIGTTKTVLYFPYSGNNDNVKHRFSILATTQNNLVESIHFLSNYNCRYAIHDDFATQKGTNIFKNCYFEGGTVETGNAYIGAGMGVENDYIISNCVFKDSNTRSISYHNNVATAMNKLIIEGCYCEGVIYIFHYGTSTEKTPVLIHDCKAKTIILGFADETNYPNENMELLEWNNIKAM